MLKNLLVEFEELMIKCSNTDNNNNNNDNNNNNNDDDDDDDKKKKLKDYIKNYKVLLVVNKIDLLEENISNVITKINSIFSLESTKLSSSMSIIDKIHPISCITTNGLNEFEQSISLSIQDLLSSHNSEEGVVITRDRHRHHIKQCIKHLNRFLLTTLPMDAAAEELRLASRELGKVTGRVDIEEILDIIFKDFCIGK
jgi:tRNA modification GTPase